VLLLLLLLLHGPSGTEAAEPTTGFSLVSLHNNTQWYFSFGLLQEIISVANLKFMIPPYFVRQVYVK